MPNSYRVNLLDASRWTLKWNDSVSGAAPLSKVLSPLPFSSALIALYINNPDKMATWNYAGLLAQKANLAAFGEGIEIIQTRKVFLERYSLLAFNFIPAANYHLEFQPAEWHSKVTIKAWEYMGD